MHHRAAALAAGVALAALSLIAYRHVETGFVPTMDEGAFVLDYWAPPGAALPETERMLSAVDAVLRDTPEVEAFARRTGAELGFFLTESNRGDYSVRLRAARARDAEAVIDDVRDRLAARVPGLRVEFVQVLQDMIGDLSGNPSPIEIKLFGDDPAALRALAPRLAARIRDLDGVVDEFDGITTIGPTYDVDVDGRRAALAGLDAAAVQHWLETAITGTLVGQVIEGDRAIPLRLRYPVALQQRLRDLDGLTMITPDGGLAPLASVARLRPGAAEVQHERENLRPVVRVTAGLEGGDLGSTTAAVRRRLADFPLPAGVTLEYGGLYASQQEAFAELLLVFAAAVAGVGALLLVEFGSLAAAAAIVLGSAMALSGSLLALWLTRTPLNVSSIVGIIMVVGIVAKNGILLLDFAGRAEARLAHREAALVEAGRVRLRPILMTTLAALAGLAPLALGIGAGAQMQQPLAIAILGGITVSMLCSLIGIPVLYVLLSPRRSAGAAHAPAGG
ncbi:MAG: efflux RND transporter permease subunit [Candidatus Binatia bacterium]